MTQSQARDSRALLSEDTQAGCERLPGTAGNDLT